MASVDSALTSTFMPVYDLRWLLDFKLQFVFLFLPPSVTVLSGLVATATCG